MSQAAVHVIEPSIYWHARAMVLAWGVLLPMGALVARFFKVWPGQRWPQVLDHKAWWHLHRTLQWAGVGVMLLGLWLVSGQAAAATVIAQGHGALGWVVCALGAFQIVGGLLRGSKGGPGDAALRGDHYHMTVWRCSFERLHKGLGWLALLLACVVMGLGLVLLQAPSWMVWVLCVWWLLLAAVFVHLQRAGRCVDTYQAIWGPDPRHPGNQRRPIGWGVSRLSQSLNDSTSRTP